MPRKKVKEPARDTRLDLPAGYNPKLKWAGTTKEKVLTAYKLRLEEANKRLASLGAFDLRIEAPDPSTIVSYSQANEIIGELKKVNSENIQVNKFGQITAWINPPQYLKVRRDTYNIVRGGKQGSLTKIITIKGFDFTAVEAAHLVKLQNEANEKLRAAGIDKELRGFNISAKKTYDQIKTETKYFGSDEYIEKYQKRFIQSFISKLTSIINKVHLDPEDRYILSQLLDKIENGGLADVYKKLKSAYEKTNKADLAFEFASDSTGIAIDNIMPLLDEFGITTMWWYGNNTEGVNGVTYSGVSY